MFAAACIYNLEPNPPKNKTQIMFNDYIFKCLIPVVLKLLSLCNICTRQLVKYEGKIVATINEKAISDCGSVMEHRVGFTTVQYLCKG